MKRMLTRVALALAAPVLGLVLALGVAGALYREKLEIPTGFAGEHVPVAGLSLRVLQQGTGRDLLFIHGSPGSLEDFAPQANELAATFRVTRYDRPGHGFSSTGKSYSLAYNAKVARALIDKLKLERVIVVGHSYGGSTALVLSALRSPRIAAYVLIDSAVYKNARPLSPLYECMAMPVFGLGLAGALPRAIARKKVAEALRAEFVGPPPVGFVELRAQIWTEPKVAYALANERVHSQAELSQQSARYAEIKAPLYFVSQTNDPARVANAERFKREVKQTVLELVPNSGHYIQVEQPAAVTRMIRRAASEHP